MASKPNNLNRTPILVRLVQCPCPNWQTTQQTRFTCSASRIMMKATKTTMFVSLVGANLFTWHLSSPRFSSPLSNSASIVSKCLLRPCSSRSVFLSATYLSPFSVSSYFHSRSTRILWTGNLRWTHLTNSCSSTLSCLAEESSCSSFSISWASWKQIVSRSRKNEVYLKSLTRRKNWRSLTLHDWALNST